MIISNGNYILKWIDKSKNENDYFDKFVYGFFALNAMYSIFYEDSERIAIKTLFDETEKTHSEDFRKILYTPEYEYFCNRAAIKNCKYDPYRDPPSFKDSSRDTRKLQERDVKGSNKAMLMILYQIRCNLFHGNKSFSDANDQEIMKNASELLLKYNLIFQKMLDSLN